MYFNPGNYGYSNINKSYRNEVDDGNKTKDTNYRQYTDVWFNCGICIRDWPNRILYIYDKSKEKEKWWRDSSSIITKIIITTVGCLNYDYKNMILF